MKLFFLLFFLSSTVMASSVRTIDADSFESSDHSKTWTPPSITDTLAGISATQTLTSKTISGSSNTLTNIDLTTAVTNTLGVNHGGTGLATLTANSLLVGNGTSAVSLIAPGSSGNVLISNGTSWASQTNPATPIMSIAQWFEGAKSPSPVFVNNNRVYDWVSGQGQTLYTNVTIPFTYISGTQITLRIKFYSPTYSSGNDLMTTVSTLVRTGTDAVTSTTNQRTSTNTAATPAGSNIPYLVSFDLTDSTGKINGVSVSAGDTLNVALTRGTDTDTGDIQGLVWAAEVLY